MRIISIGCLLAVLAMAGAPGASAGEESASVVDEVLSILKDRGLVDEGEYQRLVAKNASWEKDQHPSWLPKLEFWGDFRGRYEGFWFRRDETGNDRDNRNRGRYRLRLNAKAEVNDWASFFLRLSSGQDDNRSANQTFGSGVDFDPDSIFIDRAYAELASPKEWIPFSGGSAKLRFGKIPNPFVWKTGKDFMLWDRDINPEGVSLSLGASPAEDLKLFAHVAHFVIDENSSTKDPHLWGFQVGGHYALNDSLRLGARTSIYRFDSLDRDFVDRSTGGADAINGASTPGGGSIVDGLTGGAAGGDMRVAELAAYLRWSALEDWPLLAYGTWARNLDAEDSLLFPQASKEDNAWGVGLEIGDKQRYAKLGVGYWHIEANAFPSQFVDSDLFDGHTNREGFAFYGSRSILSNTDLNLSVFVSDEIEQGLPAFADSVSNAERVRLQADLVFKF